MRVGILVGLAMSCLAILATGCGKNAPPAPAESAKAVNAGPTGSIGVPQSTGTAAADGETSSTSDQRTSPPTVSPPAGADGQESEGKLADGSLAHAGMTGDTVGVVVIRPKRFFQSRFVKNLFGDKPPKRLDAYGVDVQRCEEVVIWIGDSIRSNDESPLIRLGVRSSEPVDAEAVGRILQLRKPAYQADDRTVLVASQEGLDAMLAKRRSVDAALSDRVGRMSADRDVSGVFHFGGKDPLAPVEAILKANGIESPQAVALIDAMKPVRQIGRHSEWASIEVDLTSLDWLTLTTESRSPDSATTVKETIDGAVSSARETLEESPFAGFVTPYLDKLVVTREGARTTAKLTPGAELTAQTVALLKQGLDKEMKRNQVYARYTRLRQISKAFHNAHDTRDQFPPWKRPNGSEKQPHLSWRVQLLPFLDETELYDQFHLDEPWDSAHNKTLLARMPQIYQVDGVDDPTKTSLRVFTGPDTPFPDGFGVSLSVFEEDGAANTLLMVEAGPDVAVPWTKPEEIVFDPTDPWKALGRIGDEGLLALFADGRAQSIAKSTSADELKTFVTPNGKDN